MAKDFLSIDDISDLELAALLDAADQFSRGTLRSRALEGKHVAMIFEKPSLRTRVSFDAAVHDLGGHAVYLSRDEVGLDTREPAEDVAKVLERWVAVIVARVFAHGTLERLAAAAGVPVVNALSDDEHPCQAMADLLTIRQRFGRLDGLKVAFVGDANNCARSLALGCAASGAQFAIATPNGYGLGDAWVALINARYARRGLAVETTNDPHAAVHDADVVYTDVWTSMGQEAEGPRRRADFAGFEVDEALLGQAKPHAILMHPMPAHYGEEVSPGFLDHPRSVAFDQAENRLHAQKAILASMMEA